MRLAALVAVSVVAASAAVAQTLPSKIYQENVFKQCTGGGIFCQAIFPAFAADRILKVNSVSCRVYLSARTAIFSHVQLASDKGDGPFYLDVTPISNPEGRAFHASFSAPVYLSAGAAPRVTVYSSGSSTVSFDCNVAGVTEKAPAAGSGEAAD